MISAPGSGETPSLYVDGAKVAATFDAVTNTLTPTVPLAEGSHVITYTLTNANGESAQSPGLSIVIDTTLPDVIPASAPDMTAVTDTGSSTGDDLTRNSRPSFVVEAPPTGLTPVLLVDGIEVPSVFDALTNTLTPINSIPSGAHTISTALQDAAGNTGPASTGLDIVITPVAALDPSSDTGPLGDLITRDNTPSIQGFGTPGDTVTVTFPGGEVKSVLITNPDGSWQVTPTTPLPEGANAISVVATSPSGAVTSSNTLNLTVDSVAPSAPLVTAIPENATGGAISASEAADGTILQVSIPSDAKAGDTLTLNLGGSQVLYIIQASDIGTVANVPVSVATLTSLSDGTVPVSATITDAAGNVSATSLISSLTLDRAAPSAPSITSVPENNSAISAAEASDGVIVTVSLSGDARAGDTLSVTINGSPTNVTLTATDISNGSVPVTIPNGTLPAADGTYSLTAQVIDAAGNTSAPSAPFDITLDRGLPITPATAPDMTAGTDSGVNTDDTTKDTTPDFAIPAPGPGETPSLYVDGVKVPATFDPLTNTLTPTSPLSEGPHTISYTLTDAAGNESTRSPDLPVTIDTTAPAAPAAPDMTTATDSGTNTGDDSTNDTTPDFTVVVPVDHTATLYVDGVAVPASLVAGVLTPTNPLPGGAHSISYTVTDPSGNESAQSSALPISIDTAAPGTPTITAAPENAGGGINTAEANSNNSAGQPGTDLIVSIPADAQAGDVLTLKLGSAVGAPTVAYTVQAGDIGGSATVPVPKTTLDLLADGTIAVTATLTDAAGNTSAPSAPFDITLDRGLPITPATAPDMTAGTDSGVNTDDTTKDTTPDFAIPAPGPGETPSLYVDGVKVPATFDPLTNTLTPTSPLSEGPHTISYTLTDAAGNESTRSPDLPVTIDTTAPAAPAAPDMTTATDSGTNTGDDSTNDTTPDFTVVVPVDHTATLYVDGVAVPASLVAGVLTPTNPLPGGAHSISYTVTDPSGNESAQSSALPISIDTAAPGTPTITAAPENAGGGINTAEANSNNSAGQPGTDLIVSIPADAQAGDVLTLKLGSAVGAPTVAYTVQAGDIGGSATVPVPKTTLDLLADGTIAVTATLTDAAGNTSAPSAPFDITLDRGLPITPATAPDMTAGTDSGVNTDDTTKDTTPDFAIPAPGPGETPSLYVDGVKVPATFDPLTNTLTPTSPLSEGPHTISYTLTDAAGNESARSPDLPVTIDTTAPAAPAAPDMTTATDSGTNTGDDSTNDTTPDFTVVVPVDHTATLYVDGVAVPASLVAGVLTPTNPLPGGAHSISYTVTDPSGNESAQSSALPISIDTAAPGTPTITAAPENAGGGINTAEANSNNSAGQPGTDLIVSIPADAQAGDVLTLKLGSAVGAPTVAYTVQAGDIGGSATVPVPKTTLDLLADGTIAVTATLTDAAGNTSAPSAPFDITLDRGLPDAPTALDLFASSDSGVSTSDNYTNDTTPTITGAAVEPGATVTLYDTDGTTVLGTTVADGGGTWSITPISPLADGLHEFKITQTDVSGNTSPLSTSLNVTIDTGSPSTPTAPDLATSSDSGIVDNDNYTNETAPEFAVTIPPGHTASLFIDGIEVPSTLVAGVLTPINPIAEGPHTVTYTVTDEAGNESGSSPDLAITIDTVATAAPVINSIPENSGGGVTLAEQGDGTVIRVDIPSSAKAGDSLLLSIGGQSVGYIIGAGDIGGTANVPVSDLILTALGNDGVHPVTAQITDQAGNVSAVSSSYPLVLTNAALTSPIVTAVPENDSGGINAAEASNGTIVTVDITGSQSGGGAVALGDTLVVTINGVAADPVTLTATTGPFSVFFAAGQLPPSDGVYNVTAVILENGTGLAGPVSPAFPITIDRTAPTAPAATPDLIAGSDTGGENDDNKTSDTTPSFAIPAPGVGETPSLYLNGAKVPATFDSVTNTLTPIDPIPEGAYDVTYTLTDAVGNESGQSPALTNVVIDTTVPSAPIAPDMTPATDSGTNSGDDSTNDTTPTFTVAAPAAGEIPKLYVDGVLVPSTFDSLTNTLTPTNPLPDGAHSITTTITDAAGNESPQSPSLAISIDTTAPSAPTVTAVPENSNGGVNAAEASDGSIIQVAIPADAKAGDVLTLTIGSGPSTQTVTYTVLAGDVGSTANVPVDDVNVSRLTRRQHPGHRDLDRCYRQYQRSQCAIQLYPGSRSAQRADGARPTCSKRQRHQQHRRHHQRHHPDHHRRAGRAGCHRHLIRQ